MDDGSAIEAARDRLLEGVARERLRVRSSDRYAGISKKIAAGLDAGRAALESTPIGTRAADYFTAIDAALAAARERLEQDDDDEDGWSLGGLAWVRNRVDEERTAFGFTS